MKNTLGITRFLGKPKTVDNWMLSALKRHDKKLWTDLRRAAANYKNIVGSSPSPVNFRFSKIYRQWLKIQKGRNLFLKGFGKFDISAAVKGLDINLPHICCPMDVTASGYGFNCWLFKRLVANPASTKHYLRYRSFWSANKNRLDELTTPMAFQLICENPDMTPDMLLRALEAERQRWAMPTDVSPEPFAHLVTAPAIDTPFGMLRPIKSPQEVAEVGQAMKNCAPNYISSIRQKSSLLLALFDQAGHPIALGEVHYDARAKRWIWGQRLGPNNENLEKNLYEVFQTYPLAASGVWEGRENMIED